MTFDENLRQLIQELDQICLRANRDGMSGRMIAGTLLARVNHWYLMEDQSDVEGLEKLLEYSLKQLRDRPQWRID